MGLSGKVLVALAVLVLLVNLYRLASGAADLETVTSLWVGITWLGWVATVGRRAGTVDMIIMGFVFGLVVGWARSAGHLLGTAWGLSEDGVALLIGAAGVMTVFRFSYRPTPAHAVVRRRGADARM